MTLSTTTHLNFRGDARAALEYYQSVFGGELSAFTFAQAGAVEDPAEADHVIWGQVESEAGFRVMAFDVPSSRPWDQGQASFFVSLRSSDEAEITASWEKLTERSTVVVPLAPAGWSPLYGMATDPFGVTWVLDVAVASAG